MRILKLTLVALASIICTLVGVVGLGAAGVLGREYLLYPRPELLRELKTATPDQITSELQKRFPLGTDNRALLHYLHQEKYEFDAPKDGMNRAVLRWHRFPCIYAVWVSWEEGPERRLLALSGLTWVTCP